MVLVVTWAENVRSMNATQEWEKPPGARQELGERLRGVGVGHRPGQMGECAASWRDADTRGTCHCLRAMVSACCCADCPREETIAVEQAWMSGEGNVVSKQSARVAGAGRCPHGRVGD